MLINPDSSTTNSSAIMPVATACSNCGVEERRFLHQVRHRGVFRRLCTTCVLRLHPQSFCPTCFQVYPPPPPNDAVVTCFKCYSSSHSRCVEPGPKSPPNPYTCPLCLHPNTPIFKLKSRKEAVNGKIEDFKAMDRDAATKLLAAAKIASVSMNKAAVAAKAEAERRAKEAAYARKRAKEALEHVAHLVMKEKLSKREATLALARPGAGFSGIGTNGGYSAPAVKIDRETNVNASSSNRNGSVALFNASEKLNIAGNVDRDNSSQVLAALNAVELRENEKLGGDNFDKKGAGGLIGEMKNGSSSSDHVILSDMQTGVETLDTQEEEIEGANNEVVLVQPVQGEQ
ncbi:hypothetical protein ACS0TY_002991 [Phlomoides rotata]